MKRLFRKAGTGHSGVFDGRQRDRFRFILTMFAFAVAAAFLLLRIFYLQVIEHRQLRALSEENRMSFVPLIPPRGSIYSADNVLLAGNKISYIAEIIPEEVTDMATTLEKIQSLIALSDNEVSIIRKSIRQQKSFKGTLIKEGLNDEEIAVLSLHRHMLHGVRVTARLVRSYPFAEEFAHVIGYIGKPSRADLARPDFSDYERFEWIGKTGIERVYEKALHGGLGYQTVEVNSRGRILRTLTEESAQRGKSVRLTIDTRLQHIAHQALLEKKGAVLAINPETGAILAMVSSPSFNPEHLFIDSLRRLTDNTGRQINRTIQGTYAPGSVIKPFLALAALEYDAIPSAQELWCPGWFKLSRRGRVYHDWKRTGHGMVDMQSAIEQSCDVYFYGIARLLGADRMHDFLSRFGFGRVSGIELSQEKAGLLPSVAWKKKALREPWYPGETIIFGIGQGYLQVTPMQLLIATAAIANRGALLTPHLVARSQSTEENGEASITGTPLASHMVHLADRDNWQVVIDGMYTVVHGKHGTARGIGRNSSFLMAGKTGTAQVVSLSHDTDGDGENLPEHLRDHALFIGFAPLEQPKIVVVVVVENGGHGSTAAAPIAKKLFEKYLAPSDDQASTAP